MRRTHHNRRWIRYVLTTGLGVSTALTTGAVLAQQPDQAGGQAEAGVAADAEVQTDAQPQADADVQADADAQADASPQAGANAQAGADAQPPSPPADADIQADAQADTDAARQTQQRDAAASPDAPQPPSEDPARAQNQSQAQGQLNAQGQAGLQAQSQGADQAGQQARLGIRMTDLNDMVVVEQVMPGSAAAQAGLQPGDRIISVNGQRFTGSQQLVTLVQGQNPGDMLDIVVLRNGQEQQLQATLSAWQGERDQRYSAARVDVGQDRVAQLEARLQRLEAEVQMLRQQSMNRAVPGAAIQPGAPGFEADANFGAGATVNPPAAPAAGDAFGNNDRPLENRLDAGAPADADDPSPETGKARLPD